MSDSADLDSGSIPLLYYVHDPMCSWCWAFRPVWLQLLEELPRDIQVVKVLGGLAPDTDSPMPEAMRQTLQATWRRIQETVPGTEFNFDFWSRNTPRRSTYPACRAVLAAESLRQGAGDDMTLAIQRAYYTQARNPSNADILTELAGELKLDAVRFSRNLMGADTQVQLDKHQALSRNLGVTSFPSLVFEHVGQRWPVAIDYISTEDMRDQILYCLEDRA